MDDAYSPAASRAALGGEPADSAAAAMRLAGSFATNEEGLGASQSARNLHASGLDEDIAWCARESVLDVVPRFSRMVGTAAEVTLCERIASRSAVRPRSPRTAWWRRASRSRPAPGCARSSAAGTRPTRRWPRRRCSPSPSRRGTASAATTSRIVWRDGRADGLDSAGPAPARRRPTTSRSTTHGAAVGHRAGRRRRLGGARRALRAARPRRVPRRRDRRRRERLRRRRR